MTSLAWRDLLRNSPISRTARPNCLHAVLVLVGAKAIGAAVLVVWSAFNGKNAHTLLSARWDSLWYVRVVEHGYDFTLTAKDGRVLSDMAFFPLFPALEGLVSKLLLISPANAGLVVSSVSALFAAAGIYALVEHFLDHRSALVTVALWATLPVSVVQSMAYSESLFTALAAWALFFTLKENWPAAGALACCAGLTRPVGLAAALALWTAVAVSVRREGRSGLTGAKVIGAVLAPAGFCGYVLWVGTQRGSLFGYLDVQAEWGNGFDGGVAFFSFAASLALHPPYAAGLALLAGVGIAIWAYALGFFAKYPLPVQVYTGVVLVLAFGSSGFFGSKPRLLIPAFSLLIPLACYLLGKSRNVRVVVLAGMCTVSAVYGAFWLNGSGPP
jgi:hypothetical protein